MSREREEWVRKKKDISCPDMEFGLEAIDNDDPLQLKQESNYMNIEF